MTDHPAFDGPAVRRLADRISQGYLNGEPAALVGCALAELTGRWLINFDEAQAETMLALHLQLVRELEAANRNILPKQWRRRL